MLPCRDIFAVPDTVLLHRRFTLRKRDISVSRNSLTCYTGRHLRIRRLILFIFAGAVYDNALTNCATRSCCACLDEITCVAVMYLTLRTGCSRGRTPKVVRPQQRKNPLPFPFSQRSHVGNLRQTIQGKGVIHKRVETAGVYPLVRPRGVSARSRAPQSATPR